MSLTLKKLLSKSTLVFGVLLLILIVWAIALNLSNYYVPKILSYAICSTLVLSFLSYSVASGTVFYCFKRIIEACVTIFVIATLTFMLLRLMPGGPFDEEKALPPKIKAKIEAKYGLDKPLAVQYFDYLKKAAVFDLGTSYKYIGRSVGEMILQNFSVSFVLGFYAFVLSFLIGIPTGLFAASRHNTFWDNFAMTLSISGVALPNFLVGSVLIVVFAYQLDWFPPALWDSSLHYVLPVVTLGIRPAAFIARLTRSTVLDVIKSDFIRTAKAKGLSPLAILYKHVLKNSMIPVLTYSGPLLAGVLSGSFVIEILFAVPGIGKDLVQSVTNRDYPLILGLTLLYSVLLVISNLLVDFLYSFFDPRIRLGV